MKTKLVPLALLGLIMLISAGCAKISPVIPVPATPPCELLPGESTALTATGGEGATTLEWFASAGQLTPNRGPTVTYTAPQDYSGAVNITVIAKNDSSSEVRGEMTCTIIAPPPNTPTFTPEPTATLTPTPTITSTPPPPLLEVFPLVDGGEDFVYINSGGVLTPKIIPNQNCIHSGIYGLQLTYDMKGQGNGGWGVHWDKAPSKYFDASGFNAFTFWVKGASGGETFQIGLKDISGKEVKLESIKFVVVSSNWMEAIALFSDFEGVNVASLQNLNFGFNTSHGSGSICVDDLTFVSVP